MKKFDRIETQNTENRNSADPNTSNVKARTLNKCRINKGKHNGKEDNNTIP